MIWHHYSTNLESENFNEKVMQFAIDHENEQFWLYPDTSAVTQMHDQVNGGFHRKYHEARTEKYPLLSNLNRENFMRIIAECYAESYSPESLVKAAKRVGISKDGLNVNWMQQDKFARAEALLAPEKPQETSTPRSHAAVTGLTSWSKEKDNRVLRVQARPVSLCHQRVD